MHEGEKSTYEQSLNNLLNSLHQTYEQNQELINHKIKELDSKIDRLEAHVKGIKTRLSTETEYLRATIKEAAGVRETLETTINDLDAETLDKIKKITEILIYGQEY